jgi:hypothetical protein
MRHWHSLNTHPLFSKFGASDCCGETCERKAKGTDKLVPVLLEKQ